MQKLSIILQLVNCQQERNKLDGHFDVTLSHFPVFAFRVTVIVLFIIQENFYSFSRNNNGYSTLLQEYCELYYNTFCDVYYYYKTQT